MNTHRLIAYAVLAPALCAFMLLGLIFLHNNAKHKVHQVAESILSTAELELNLEKRGQTESVRCNNVAMKSLPAGYLEEAARTGVLSVGAEQYFDRARYECVVTALKDFSLQEKKIPLILLSEALEAAARTRAGQIIAVKNRVALPKGVAVADDQLTPLIATLEARAQQLVQGKDQAKVRLDAACKGTFESRLCKNFDKASGNSVQVVLRSNLDPIVEVARQKAYMALHPDEFASHLIVIQKALATPQSPTPETPPWLDQKTFDASKPLPLTDTQKQQSFITL